MIGRNHELLKGSEIRCSSKGEHFLPHMWDPSRFTQNNCKSVIYVTVGEQTYVTQGVSNF